MITILEKYKKNGLVMYGVTNSQRIPNQQINKFLNHKRKVERRSNNTVKSLASDLNLFLNFLERESIELDEVDMYVLVNFRESLINEYSPKTGKPRKAKTINRYLKSVISFYRYLYTYSNISTNLNQYTNTHGNKKNCTGILDGIATRSKVTTNLLTIRESKFDEEILTYEELNLIVNSCKSKRDKLIMRVLIETGMRIGELLNLEIEDIDMSNTALCIIDRGYEEEGYNLKSICSERKIPISKNLLNDLINYIIEEYPGINSTYIFNKNKGANKGEQLDYTSIHALFKRIKKISKIDRLHTHLIRSTTITNWILAGMDKVVIKTLAGHKSIYTTEKYYVRISLLKTREELDIYERNKLLSE